MTQTIPGPSPNRFPPLQLLLALVAGIVNRHQRRVIDFLVAEDKILKAALGEKRVRIDDDQRRRLAILGKALGRDLLDRYASVVTPETIQRWHRRLVALEWMYANGAKGKIGRPRTPEEIERLVVKMAKENPGWGYDRIEGALANLGHEIAATTIGAILTRNGIPPASRRRSTWAQFIKSHHAVLAGANFFTTEVWTKLGLTTVYTLFAIRLATRSTRRDSRS